MLKIFFKVTLPLLIGGQIVLASEAEVQAQLQQAQSLYDKRDVVDSSGNYTNVLQAITILDQAIKNATTDDLKYDIQILASRSNYWLGAHNNNKESKLQLFQNAMAKATAAKAINDDYAEGYYYYGVALGRWAETNGVVASLGRKQELIDSMEATQLKDTHNNQKGETIDGYGPNRILGRIYFKLPFLAGGSKSKSLENLNRAYKQAPLFFLNGIYLAETLADGNSSEKAQACTILKEISAKTPESGAAERLPENKEDISDANKLLAQVCK